MAKEQYKKCKCGKAIKAKYAQCQECKKNDPYNGWYGVYMAEKRGKKVR